MVENNWIAQALYGGWFRVYAFVVFLGFLLSFVGSYFCFKKRNIPTRPLELSIFIIVIPALIGASIFGKWNIDKPIPWYELFAFWQPGLSIHGGLIFGIITGFFWFHYQGKKYRVSNWVYADAILPNILIGQAIGRWGNFFNHELLGAKTSYNALKWLPAFIRDNCFKWFIPNPIPNHFIPSQAQGMGGGGVNPNNTSSVQYYQPIFLYESFMCVVIWIFILFILPKLWNYFLRLSIQHKNKKKYSSDFIFKMFYNIEPKKIELKNIANKPNYLKEYLKLAQKLQKKQKLKFFWKYKWKTYKSLFHQKIPELEKLHNPYHLNVKRAGVSGSLYIILYNIVRFGLETTRTNSDLFIINIRWLDYTLIWLFIILGFISLFFAQFISPNKWRQKGWYYEKHY